MGWILHIRRGTLTGSRIELMGQSYRLGRAPDCEIRFHPVQERVVSGHHAELMVKEGRLYLRDLRSRNGTTVNGTPVTETELKPGDVVRLGGEKGPEFTVDYRPDHMHDSAAPVGKRPSSSLLRQSMTRFSTYQPERHREVSLAQIGIGAVAGLFVLVSILVIMFLEIGPAGTLVGALFALFPAPFYLFIYLWMDRYDPEPGWALAAAFAWGAVVSIFIAFGFNVLLTLVLHAVKGAGAADFLSASVVAPIVEEFIKGIGVLLFWLFLRREFDDVVDGIVYAGVIALGFATVENILYYGRSFQEEGAAGLLVVWVLRGLLSPFSHAFFTSMTGIGCGLARESHVRVHRIVFPLAGLFLAMVLHGAWNTLALVSGDAFFLVYFAVWVPLFMAFIGLIVFLVRREGRIIRSMLEPEVLKGFLRQEDIKLIASFFGRIRWLVAALPDVEKFRLRRRFLRAATRLAFCYWHVERARTAHAYTLSFPRIPQIYEEVRTLYPRVME